VVARVVALDVFSNWVGFLLTAGLIFSFFPPAIPRGLHLPFRDPRPIGWLLLSLFLAYLAVSHWRKLRLPHGPIFLLQVGVAALDFVLGGAALYWLLRDAGPLPFANFLAVYLLAQVVTIVSHVPGGLGVFETVVLVSLRARISGPELWGALIAYRAIYFFLPLLVAAAGLVAFEIRNGTRSGGRWQSAKMVSEPAP
jgi:uncharacterized membrane protein YbhN (UPF0104 family)